MKRLMLAASAALVALSLPVAATAQGNSNKAKAQVSAKANARASGAVRPDVRARTDARANARAATRTGATADRRYDSDNDGVPDFREQTLADANNNGIADYRERRLVDINGNGIADWREARIDRDRDGIDDRAEGRYGGFVCPPGLAKRTPACVPPGQVNRAFREGQRVPTGYRYYTDINGIPVGYRDDIPGAYRTGDYRYIYRDNTIYVVDRSTRLVRRIIDLLD